MGGPLCRLCGTEQPVSNAALEEQSPAAARAAQREEVISTLTLKVREQTERAETAEARVAELEARAEQPKPRARDKDG